MDIPVKQRFRQTRYTYIRFRSGIKLFCADRIRLKEKQIRSLASRTKFRGTSQTLDPKPRSSLPKGDEEPESGVAYHQRLTGTTYTA